MAQYKRIPYEMVEHTELARKSYQDYECGKNVPDEAVIEAETLEQRAKLRQALEKLTPRQREVYVLKVGYQLSEAKIAHRLHISQTGVSYHFKMAEKKLQKNTVK